MCEHWTPGDSAAADLIDPHGRTAVTAHRLTPTNGIGEKVPEGTMVKYSCWYADGPFPDSRVMAEQDGNLLFTNDVPWGVTAAVAQQEATRWLLGRARNLPEPAIVLSPKEGQRLLLGMALWLSTTNTPVTDAVQANGATVTFTAVPRRSEWVFDAPDENDAGEIVEVCEGPGTTWDREKQYPRNDMVDDHRWADELCGVTSWHQTGPRPATVTLTWEVTATSSFGAFAPFEVTTSRDFTYHFFGVQAVGRR